MLLTIQLPFADSRAFLNGGVEVLGRPTWPSASPDSDFVRSFGSVRKRKLGGLRNWVGESVICEASRALRFSRIPNFRDTDTHLNIPLKLSFRRFYFDGLAVGKFEVGLTTRVADTGRLAGKQTEAFLHHCLNLPVAIPPLSNKAVSEGFDTANVETVLGKAAKPLSRFYAGCSISHPPPIKLNDWWVRPGSPLLFLVHGFSERMRLPFFGKPVPLRRSFSDGDSPLNFDLSYFEVPYADSSLRMWVMGLTPYANYRDVRAVRICLLRLHAEHESMRLVLRNLATGKIDITPRSTGSNTLQLYLNEATKRISRLGAEADSMSDGDLAERARESIDLVSPGEREALLGTLRNLDVRKNIFYKIEDYVNTQINIRELYMESKYKITGGVQGAVGDNAVAANNNFAQWNLAGGDLAALGRDLATLKAELRKVAEDPAQFESVAAIAKAEAAAESGDGPTAFEHLKSAGIWALEVAKSIAVPVATAALTTAIGIG